MLPAIQEPELLTLRYADFIQRSESACFAFRFARFDPEKLLSGANESTTVELFPNMVAQLIRQVYSGGPVELVIFDTLATELQDLSREELAEYLTLNEPLPIDEDVVAGFYASDGSLNVESVLDEFELIVGKPIGRIIFTPVSLDVDPYCGLNVCGSMTGIACSFAYDGHDFTIVVTPDCSIIYLEEPKLP